MKPENKMKKLGKKAVKTSLKGTSVTRSFNVAESHDGVKGCKSPCRQAEDEMEYSSDNLPVPQSVLHILNTVIQIILQTKPRLELSQLGYGYSEIEGEYSFKFWDDHLDEEDPEATIDPDYYNDLHDVFLNLNENNFNEQVYFDFDRYEIIFEDKMEMYKLLQNFITAPETPLMTADSLTVAEPSCPTEENFTFEDMPNHLSPTQKKQLFENVTSQVQTQFEETHKKERVSEVCEHWKNNSPESDSMFRTIPPRGYSSREDFMDACFHMNAVPLTDSLGHILKLIIHEDKIEAPTGTYGHFLNNSYGGCH